MNAFVNSVDVEDHLVAKWINAGRPCHRDGRPYADVGSEGLCRTPRLDTHTVQKAV